MFFIKLNRFSIALIVFFSIVSPNIASENFNSDDVDILIKTEQRRPVRAYMDTPDANLFFNDAFNLEPCKLVNYSDYLESMYSGWDAKEINKKHPESSLVFGTLEQFIGGKKVEANTNLRRFLNQKDEYTSETKAKFRLPKFIRLIVFNFILTFFKSNI